MLPTCMGERLGGAVLERFVEGVLLARGCHVLGWRLETGSRPGVSGLLREDGGLLREDGGLLREDGGLLIEGVGMVTDLCEPASGY